MQILFFGLTPCVESRLNPVSWCKTGYMNARIKEFNSTLRKEQSKFR